MKIDVMSLAYNRLMNHVRYMVAKGSERGTAQAEYE